MAFTPRFETLIDIYDHAIKSFGHRELFGTKRGGSWTWTTYAEFGKKVDAFRGGLASLGVGKGDVVAIYEAQHPKEWEFIVKDCDAKVLIGATDDIVAKTRPMLDSIKSLKAIVSLAGTNGADGDGERHEK